MLVRLPYVSPFQIIALSHCVRVQALGLLFNIQYSPVSSLPAQLFCLYLPYLPAIFTRELLNKPITGSLGQRRRHSLAAGVDSLSQHSHGLPPFLPTTSSLVFTIMSSNFNNAPRDALTDNEMKTTEAIQDGLNTANPCCCSGHVPVEVTCPGIFYAATPATFSTKWTKNETPIITG